MRIAVLNFESGALDIIDLDEEQLDLEHEGYDDAVQKYLVNEMGYGLDNIYYMSDVKQINFVESK